MVIAFFFSYYSELSNKFFAKTGVIVLSKHTLLINWQVHVCVCTHARTYAQSCIYSLITHYLSWCYRYFIIVLFLSLFLIHSVNISLYCSHNHCLMLWMLYPVCLALHCSLKSRIVSRGASFVAFIYREDCCFQWHKGATTKQ